MARSNNLMTQCSVQCGEMETIRAFSGCGNLSFRKKVDVLKMATVDCQVDMISWHPCHVQQA